MESKKKSLDAVDLNILPISQKLDEGRLVILKSKNDLGLRNKENYKLEIKTNDTREERNDQVIENVICHICDINVPNVYFNEHKNSFRHKFNVKIADIALRRLQLFINKDDVNESNRKIPSKRYCSECSLVIDSDDEMSHKQSIVHKNSIFLERFLNDFLKFYTSDEQETNDSKENSKQIEVATKTKQCADSEKDFDSDKLDISETVITSDLREDGKKIEVAMKTKQCEDSEKDFDSDKLDISETVITSDLREDCKKIEVAMETKQCEDSEKDFDSDKLDISESVITSDLREDGKKIEVAMETKQCEDSEKDFDSDKLDISETVIISDLREDDEKIEVAIETKQCEDSEKDFDSDKLDISETVIISDSREDGKKIEVAIETKQCEDSEKDFDSDKLDISETVVTSDLREDGKKIEVAMETKQCEDSEKDFDSDKLDISETVIISDLREDGKKIEVAMETKQCEDSEKDFDSDKLDISETVIISDLREDDEKIEVAIETKQCEDSEKDFDSDKLDISETVIISDSREDGKKIEVAIETKQCEDSEKDFDSDKLDISETVIISDSKEDGKISKKDLDSVEENKKMDLKALQVEDEVVNGGRFIATELNFNTVTKISALFEYCMICDQIFVIEKRSLHLNSDLHCKNLLQKLPDEYGIRKVNNTQDHCILCNNYFNNYVVHINSKEHITNFQNMLIPDKYKKTAEICYNVNADKINVNTKSQDSDILKSNESKSSTDTNGHTAPLNNKKNKTEEIDEFTDKIETGNAIKTAVTGNATDGKEVDAANANKAAVTGNATDSKVLDAANANKTAVTVNATDSKVVDVANATKTAVTGNATDTKVVDAANSKALKTVDKGGRLYKTAIINKIIETAKQSENAVKHGSNSYFCNVCQVQVPNNVNNISLHNKGIPHKLKLRQADTKVKETSNLHYQMVKNDTKNIVTCFVCDVDLTYNDKNISTHIKGEPHKNNYSVFCKRNLLVPWNNAVYCIVCRVNLGVGYEINHCIGKNHKKNLENVSQV